jgi:pimeloyl-ACP methyl ester carboxylesterase
MAALVADFLARLGLRDAVVVANDSGWSDHLDPDGQSPGANRPQAANDYLEPSRDRAVRRDLGRFLRSVHRRHTLAAAERLPEFNRPVLLAWAQEDQLFPIALAHRLAEPTLLRHLAVDVRRPARVAKSSSARRTSIERQIRFRLASFVMTRTPASTSGPV